MGRPQPERKYHRKNFNEPGHAHELTFSCFRRIPLLSRDRTCEWLNESIEHARISLHFDVWAWVFMPDHVHLIVHPRQSKYDVAAIRRLIKEPVSRKAIAWIGEYSPNWLANLERVRGNRTEHLFWQSGGGYDRNITEGDTLVKMIDYIHHNPCRKGLVVGAQEWKWSSAAWYVRKKSVPLMPDSIPPEWLEDSKLGP